MDLDKNRYTSLLSVVLFLFVKGVDKTAPYKFKCAQCVHWKDRKKLNYMKKKTYTRFAGMASRCKAHIFALTSKTANKENRRKMCHDRTALAHF